MDGKHLSSHDLDDLLAGAIDGPTEKAMRRHLAACNECRTRHDALRDIVIPIAPAEPAPSPRLRERILDSYDRMAVHAFDRPHALWRLPRPAVAAIAAAAVAAVTAVLYLGLVRQPDDAGIVVAALDGTVTVDGSPAGQGKSLGEGERIEVARESFLMLHFAGAADILIPGKTSLSVKRLGAGLFNGDAGMVIELKKGTIAAIHHYGGNTVICRYQTDDGIVEHLGTEFLLTAGKAGTQVMVKSGRIRMIPQKAAGELEAGAGEKIIAAGSATKEMLTKEDLATIDLVILMGKEKRFIPAAIVQRPVAPVSAEIPDEKIAPDKDEGQTPLDEGDGVKKSEKKGFRDLRKLKNGSKGPGGTMSGKHGGR